MLNTPVLFLIFNRPEITKKVFKEISCVQPRRLYIAADGPRSEYAGERELCEKTRNICSKIDWDCEVFTLFRDENMGCRLAVSTAIDWFFKNEENGIVLEDDCLPSPSFFRYCSELLDYYRDDERVMCISGDNFQQGNYVTKYSYYFSKYSHCWGWATWRRAWDKYDAEMSLWPEFLHDEGLTSWSDGNENFKQYWKRIFDSSAAGKIDSWAYRWTFSCWAHNGLTCLPHSNLVKNIGFGDCATHTRSGKDWRESLTANNLNFPIHHPSFMVRNVGADMFSDKVCFGIPDELSRNTESGCIALLMKNKVIRKLKSGLHDLFSL